MLNLFSRSKLGPIGLDIGAEGVRMLQFGRAGYGLRVVAAGRCRFPAAARGADAAIGNGSSLDAKVRRRLAVEAVREILKTVHFRGRQVVSCLRSDELAVKNIRLPHLPDNELGGAVLWEAKERLGFEIVPDRLHYINAGEVRQGNDVRDEIIMLGVQEEVIRAHLEMLDEMRLVPLHVDAEPTALFAAYQRFLRRAQDESTISVIVDIGLGSTKVVVARGQVILMIKSIDLAGQKFNECVAKELGLSYSEAAHLRRRSSAALGAGRESGDQVSWSVFDAIRGQVEALAREISLCLRYCSVTFRGLRAGRITVTGGEAYDAGLLRLLGETLNCECAVGEPLLGIDVGATDFDGDRRGVLTEWSVTAGLALRDLSIEPSHGKVDHDASRIPA